MSSTRSTPARGHVPDEDRREGRGVSQTTDLLRSHRLVSTGWRIVRPDGRGQWHAVPTRHVHREGCPCSRFDRLADALLWTTTQEGAR